MRSAVNLGRRCAELVGAAAYAVQGPNKCELRHICHPTPVARQRGTPAVGEKTCAPLEHAFRFLSRSCPPSIVRGRLRFARSESCCVRRVAARVTAQPWLGSRRVGDGDRRPAWRRLLPRSSASGVSDARHGAGRGRVCRSVRDLCHRWLADALAGFAIKVRSFGEQHSSVLEPRAESAAGRSGGEGAPLVRRSQVSSGAVGPAGHLVAANLLLNCLFFLLVKQRPVQMPRLSRLPAGSMLIELFPEFVLQLRGPPGGS